MGLIIDTVNDSDFTTDVRALLGVSTDELTDDVIESKVVVTAAEGAIVKLHVPNWIAVHNGSDQVAKDALRNCVIVMICKNLLDNSTVQKLLFDDVRLPPDIIIKSKGIRVAEIRENLGRFFEQQLALVGVERTGDSALPTRNVIGASDSARLYEYEVNDDGEIVTS